VVGLSRAVKRKQLKTDERVSRSLTEQVAVSSKSRVAAVIKDRLANDVRRNGTIIGLIIIRSFIGNYTTRVSSRIRNYNKIIDKM